MLYHYTFFDALTSILRNANTDKGLCFWATRFDCFADKEEYKLGIMAINRLLPRLEKRYRPDRRIASAFQWEEIQRNETLPYPYVVSFTDRNDNAFMWDKYACGGKGIVLELDDNQRVENEFTSGLVVKRCLYLDEIDDEGLYKEIEEEFFTASFGLLTGPKKDLAFALLGSYPQLFVALVGRYLLSYVAPRIKGEGYNTEEETRAILASPRPEMKLLVEQYEEVINSLSIDTVSYRQRMESEKVRTRASGEKVYYQEIFLPGSLLKSVYVKDNSLVTRVTDVLVGKGFDGVEVKVVH